MTTAEYTYEDLEIAEEHFHEVDTQIRSEEALYGDAWPGAQDMRQKAFDALVRIRRVLGMPTRRVSRWNAMAQRAYWVWESDEPTPAVAESADLPF